MSNEQSHVTEKAAAGMHAVSPHLVCRNAGKAVEFYKKAFGASEMVRLDQPDGKLMYACLSINGSSVMLAEENEECGQASPQSLKGTPITIHLIVDDVDAAIAKATAAGAMIVMPVADMFWGDRFGVIADPFGHHWSLATPQRVLSEEELKEAARAAMSQHAEAAGAKE